MFLAARIPIFLLFSILTCCVEKDATQESDCDFQDRIISIHFVDYMKELHNNFQHYVPGRQDFQFGAQLQALQNSVRSQIRSGSINISSKISVGQADSQVGKSGRSKFGENLNQLTLIWKSAYSQECNICLDRLGRKIGEDKELVQFPCHERHVIHKMPCWDEMEKAIKDGKMGPCCPLCRKRFDLKDLIFKNEEGNAEEIVKEGVEAPTPFDPFNEGNKANPETLQPGDIELQMKDMAPAAAAPDQDPRLIAAGAPQAAPNQIAMPSVAAPDEQALASVIVDAGSSAQPQEANERLQNPMRSLTNPVMARHPSEVSDVIDDVPDD